MKITAIKQQVKNRDRYSIFIDGKYTFGLSSATLLTQGLVVGQTLQTKHLAELKETAGSDSRYNRALRYVALRPRSVWEMTTYLKRKGAGTEEIADIVNRLQALGLLDDQTFGRAWVANRRQLKHVSRRRLALELKQKHVAEAVIEQVLNEDTYDDRDAIRQLANKKRQHYGDRTKLTQYLIRQGFRYDDVKTVLDEEQ